MHHLDDTENVEQNEKTINLSSFPSWSKNLEKRLSAIGVKKANQINNILMQCFSKTPELYSQISEELQNAFYDTIVKITEEVKSDDNNEAKQKSKQEVNTESAVKAENQEATHAENKESSVQADSVASNLETSVDEERLASEVVHNENEESSAQADSVASNLELSVDQESPVNEVKHTENEVRSVQADPVDSSLESHAENITTQNSLEEKPHTFEVQQDPVLVEEETVESKSSEQEWANNPLKSLIHEHVIKTFNQKNRSFNIDSLVDTLSRGINNILSPDGLNKLVCSQDGKEILSEMRVTYKFPTKDLLGSNEQEKEESKSEQIQEESLLTEQEQKENLYLQESNVNINHNLWESSEYVDCYTDELNESATVGSYKKAGLTWMLDSIFLDSPIMQSFVDLHKRILCYQLLSLSYFTFINSDFNLSKYNEFSLNYNLPFSGIFSFNALNNCLSAISNINLTSVNKMILKNIRQKEKASDNVDHNYYAFIFDPLTIKSSDSKYKVSNLYNNCSSEEKNEVNLPLYDMCLFNNQEGFASDLYPIYLEEQEIELSKINREVLLFKRRETSRNVTIVGCEKFGTLKNVKNCLLQNVQFITPLRFSGHSIQNKIFKLDELFQKYLAVKGNIHDNIMSLSVKISTSIKDDQKQKQDISFYVSLVITLHKLNEAFENLYDDVDLHCIRYNSSPNAQKTLADDKMIEDFASLQVEGTSSKYRPNEEAIFYKVLFDCSTLYVSSIHFSAEEIVHIYNYQDCAKQYLNIDNYYTLFLNLKKTDAKYDTVRRLLFSTVIALCLKTCHYLVEHQKLNCLHDLENIKRQLDDITCYQYKGLINIFKVKKDSMHLLQMLDIPEPQIGFNITDNLLLDHIKGQLLNKN